MTRWRCRRQQAALVDYVAGGLDDAAAARVERHLVRCPACSEAAAALRDVPALLDIAVPDPGEQFWLQQRHAIGRAVRQAPPARHDLLTELLRWIGPRWNRSRSPWRVPLATAASLLLALSVYRFVLPARHAGLSGAPALSSLDDDLLLELHDVVNVVAPHDEPLASPLPDEDLLTSLPLSDLIGSSPGPAGFVDADLDDDAADSADGGRDDIS